MRCSSRPAGGRIRPASPARDGAANLYPFQYLDDTRAISEQIDAARRRRDRRLVHRLRARRGVRVARPRDALADARPARPAPHHRRGRRRAAPRGRRGRRRVTCTTARKSRSSCARTARSPKSAPTAGEIAAECYAYGFGLAMNTEICDGLGHRDEQERNSLRRPPRDQRQGHLCRRRRRRFLRSDSRDPLSHGNVEQRRRAR